jgi:hypothetical protein
VKNASNMAQATSLNPGKSAEEMAALLEIQNITVSIESSSGLTVAEPYEMELSSLKLGEESSLTFGLLEDRESVVVSMHLQDAKLEDIHIVLRRESLQDIPTINSVQFSQEGDLNTTVRYDLILERLAEDEKTFRLALINLPREIDPAFLDPASGASLTQVKFSESTTRQQLELELQIPEKLSRRYVDETMEFHVFITDQEGFQQIAELNRTYGDKIVPVEEIAEVKGSREVFQLIPRGKAILECIIPKRYQEIKTDEEVVVRVGSPQYRHPRSGARPPRAVDADGMDLLDQTGHDRQDSAHRKGTGQHYPGATCRTRRKRVRCAGGGVRILRCRAHRGGRERHHYSGQSQSQPGA